jgi:hypothetical protein
MDRMKLIKKIERIGLNKRNFIRFNKFIRNQLLFKLGIKFNKNAKRLADLKSIHKGQRAFVIGNGPSLKISDLSRLKNEITFASNKIFLAFEETDWRPTYYSVYDLLVAQNNNNEISCLNLTKLFGSRLKNFFPKEQDIIYIDDLRNPGEANDPQLRFSKNILYGAYGGWSVIYMQIQLAFYMGISELYLIGVDFSFSVPKPSGEKTSHGEEILIHSGEHNHFHPDYRKPGEKWSVPRLDFQYKAFQCAKDAFESEGRLIKNASRQTKLDVFPLVDFDSILSL